MPVDGDSPQDVGLIAAENLQTVPFFKDMMIAGDAVMLNDETRPIAVATIAVRPTVFNVVILDECIMTRLKVTPKSAPALIPKHQLRTQNATLHTKYDSLISQYQYTLSTKTD